MSENDFDLDGGPAFPTTIEQSNGQLGGMSLMAYYMAHAPYPPPNWFEPKMPEPDPPPPLLPSQHPETAHLGIVHDHDAKKWRRDPCYDITEAIPVITPWAVEWLGYLTAMSDRRKDAYREKILQWPAYWAQEMLWREGLM